MIDTTARLGLLDEIFETARTAVMEERIKKEGKNTFLTGILASSLGVFISKALGLLYMTPFVSVK